MGHFYSDIAQWSPILLRGALLTLEVAGVSLCVSLSWGLLLALARTSHIPGLRQAAIAYIDLLRSIPVLTILFVIYFGLAAIGIVLPSFFSAVTGLGMVGGAYMAENFRGGLASVPRGQREAALTLGLRPGQAMLWVILPQAVRVAVPASINYSIALLKDTAIVSTVAIPELTFRAKGLVSDTFMPLQVFALAGALYLLMSIPLAKLGKSLERRLVVRSGA